MNLAPLALVPCDAKRASEPYRTLRRSSALLAILALISVLVSGQQGISENKNPESQAQKNATTSKTPGAQLADASNDAAGREPGKSEDENAQFKQSASVKWIARHLGVTTDQAYWLCIVINFAVVAGLIGFGLKKKLPRFFRERTAMIQKGMEEARRVSEDANRRLREIEEKLGRLDSDIAQLEATAAAQGEQEAARLKSAAEEERKSIIQTAEEEIAAAANAARRDLKAYSAELAVSLAEKRIKVDGGTDQELVREFVDRLGRNGSS